MSNVLIFLPCSDSVGETFRSVGGLGPPAELFQWGTNIASLLTFVSGGGTSDIRPAHAHYLSGPSGAPESRLAIQPITSQAHTTNYLAFVRLWSGTDHASVSITRIVLISSSREG